MSDANRAEGAKNGERGRNDGPSIGVRPRYSRGKVILVSYAPNRREFDRNIPGVVVDTIEGDFHSACEPYWARPVPDKVYVFARLLGGEEILFPQDYSHARPAEGGEIPRILSMLRNSPSNMLAGLSSAAVPYNTR